MRLLRMTSISCIVLVVLLTTTLVYAQGNGTVVSETTSPGYTAGKIALSLVALLFLFTGLAVVTDDYLVPAIEVLCEKLEIPEDAAGASFLAFGSAAPEILLNAVATCEHRLKSMETTLSAIQGSALIAFGLIPPLCVFATCKPLVVSWAPLLRDTIAYVVSLMALVCFMQDSVVTAWEASMLCLIYIVYLLAIYLPVCFNPTYGSCVLKDDDITTASSSTLLSPASPTVPSYGSSSPLDVVHLDPKSPPVPMARVRRSARTIGRLCSVPFRTLFKLTLPDNSGKSYASSLYLVTLVLSLAYVTLFSAGVLYCTRKLSSDLHLSTTTTGVTLLALGAQIPDAIASVSLARAGHANAAVCNAVGSQVINVSLGSGLPLAISSYFYGPVNMSYEKEVILWKSLAVVIGSYLLLNFNFRSVFCLYDADPRDNFIGLTKGDGAVLLTLYLLCNVAIVITL